jgi:hypothetical protein
MESFTIHLPSAAGLAVEDRIAQARAVKDGFSWPAFVFSFLWAAAHRMWGVAAALFGLELALGWVGKAVGFDVVTDIAVSTGAAIILGFVANDILRWSLGRRGLVERGVIGAHSAEEAVEAYFIANAPRDGYALESRA